MTSFDVNSLFTNIPLTETINIAVDLICNAKPDLKITRTDIFELFEFATSKTNFLFQGVVYDQIDGIAMGSALAPTLANLFMGYHEKRWLDDYEDAGPSFYRRYVDDIFAVFNSEVEAENFFNYLNRQHPNITFTQEKSTNGKLPFLDVLIDNIDGLKTSVYHKPTYTGLLTNFQSYVPYIYKVNLVRTLLDRIFKINNTTAGFDIDVKKLKYFLARNSFPAKVIGKIIKVFLDNKKTPKAVPTEDTNPPPEERYFKLPYIGEYSKQTKEKITKLLVKFCKISINIKLVFNTTKVKDYFTTKDLMPECFKSHVVYKFICTRCKSCYVGRTHRHVNTRIEEHLTDSTSSIFKHINANADCKAMCNRDSFEIIDQASTQYELNVKEGMHIKWLRPNLNKQKKHEIITLLV